MEISNFEDFLEEENRKAYKIELDLFLNQNQNNLIPPKDKWHKAFELCPFSDTKVVILGQDPYPNIIDAQGLAFSSPRITKSLFNIFTELKNDYNYPIPKSGNLEKWAKQGVLLLNTILTTFIGQRLSMQNKGWEEFTLNYILKLNEQKNHLVFILWGNNAIMYEKFIDISKHFVIKSSHPSPLSAYISFFGSKPFSKTNEYLSLHNIAPIDWDLS